jgi:hypothetical protein
MSDRFSIKEFESADFSELADMAREEYPAGDISDSTYLQWEYRLNPAGPAVIALARDENNFAAAQYVLIPREVLINDRVIKGSLSLNTLTTGRFRGNGLFLKTAEAAYGNCVKDEICFSYGIPNQNSFNGFISRLGFNYIGDLAFMVKPLNVLSIAKSFFTGSKDKKGNEIPIALDKDALAAKDVFTFNPDHEISCMKFFEQWNKQNHISIHRSPEYLKWRYMKCPSRNYTMLGVKHKEEWKAIAVIRTLHVYGMRTAVLAEFSSIDDDAGKLLLKAIAKELKKNKMDMIIAVSASGNAEHKQLSKKGFIHVHKKLLPQQLPLIVRKHQPFENEELLDRLENWHFTFGDFDIF